ncbi:YjfB family protein [Paenibacillus sp.]|uniref:YjfB family protein n=1 Tax=Paenibacillus sp. TaxID=58172 RepID=UPI0028124763|nr:YjfB family protein [Paenibacillus sp.]
MEISLDTAILKRDVSYAMYGKVKDLAKQQASQLLADFAGAQPQPAPHPNLGKVLDVTI